MRQMFCGLDWYLRCSIWLRIAMQNTDCTYGQIIEFASNFLKSLYEALG
ncbi:hypothetical protein SP19_163 [Salmonella phage 19]|nr:hypothetical protein SP19_163 [Salmonella phage 19]